MRIPIVNTISKAISKKAKKLTSRPYSRFNISWTQEKYYKHATEHKRYVHKYSDDVSVVFYNPQEFLHAIKEIFIDEVYLFKPKTKEPVIIDCGGFIGLSALYFKLRYPHSKVIVYEPDKKNYSIAKENIESWQNIQDITLLNKAIWINEEAISFIQTNDMSSAIVKDNEQNTDANIVKVETERLRNILNRKIDFLKIDIEGAEYEVLMDIDSSLINVDNLFIEYHGLYTEMYKLNTIFSILEKNNYKWYIKEADNVYPRPFYDKSKVALYDLQLNIFAFKD